MTMKRLQNNTGLGSSSLTLPPLKQKVAGSIPGGGIQNLLLLVTVSSRHSNPSGFERSTNMAAIIKKANVQSRASGFRGV